MQQVHITIQLDKDDHEAKAELLKVLRCCPGGLDWEMQFRLVNDKLSALVIAVEELARAQDNQPAINHAAQVLNDKADALQAVMDSLKPPSQ